MESMASKALVYEAVQSGVPKPLSCTANGFIDAALLGNEWKAKRAFICVLLWKGILMLTVNGWIIVFLSFRLLCEIPLWLKLPGEVLQFLIVLSAVLSSTEGMCVWCCSRRSIKPAAGEPCLSIKPPASSLGRTMLENSNVLWSCKEKERGAFQFLRAVRKEKSVSSTQKPRTGSASVLNVGIFAAGCSIPSASVYRL